MESAAQPATPAEAPDADAAIQYVGPDTYILLDAQGRPQPVLGMSYEQFVAAWKESQRLSAPTTRPRFTIEQIHLAGRAIDGHAELEVTISFRLLTDGPARIPLGLANALLRESPRWTAAETRDARGDQPPAPYVDFDPQQGGFIAGVSGRPDDRFTVALPILVPLERDGHETTLRLNCPRAPVAGLTLDLPMLVDNATATEGSILQHEKAGDSRTRLSVTGLAGDFQLSWSTAEPQRPPSATVFSATGAVWIEVDGHSIRSDARLTVSSYGNAFDRFRVRLPPGATLIQHRPTETGPVPPRYRVTLEPGTPSDRPVALVELAERQAGPVEVELSTEQPLGLPEADRAIELAGFEVLGAVRQFGDLAIHVADDWQSRWEIGPNVRQVEPAVLLPELEARQPNVAFQYDRQPWSLRTRIMARPMRVHVVPDYALEIDADEARLRAHLVYQLPGARAFGFRVRLNGWELMPEPIESGGLVAQDAVEVTDDGFLILPLAQASGRRAELAFWLHRNLPRTETELALPFPEPEADSVAAAELSVATAPAIEFAVDPSRCRGLLATPVTEEAMRTSDSANRNLLRFRSSLHDAVLVANRRLRPAEVVASVHSELDFRPRELELTQSIDYNVRYQTVDAVLLSVPDIWSIVDDRVEIVSSGPDSDGSSVTGVPLPAAATDVSQVRVPLPQPCIGRFTVRIRYRAAWKSDVSNERRLALPLPLPAELDGTTHRIAIGGPLAPAVALDPGIHDTAWQEIASPDGLKLVSTAGEAVLPLQIQPQIVARPADSVIRRVWLQSWQTGGTLQQRAAFRFAPSGERATVELPPSVSTAEVEVLLDGQLANIASRERGRIVVSLPQLSRELPAPPEHTLELRYRRPVRDRLVSRETLTPPQLVGSSALNEVYWHIVLPGDRHIIRAPDQLVAVDRWQWLGTFWGRRPTRSQTDLESWAGATTHPPPSTSQNEYLYSGLAPLSSIEVVIAPRWLIVLAASGVALAAGLLGMYVPAARRPWLVVTVTALVAAVAVAYPTPALLLAQASLAGWILATVAVFLRRRAAAPTMLRVPASTGSTNLRQRVAGRSEPIPPLPSASGTPTVPVSTVEPNR